MIYGMEENFGTAEPRIPYTQNDGAAAMCRAGREDYGIISAQ